LLGKLTHIDLRKVCARLMGVFVFVALSVAFNVAPSFVNADKAFAQTKSLKIYYTHTREREKIVFKKNGRYDKAGLRKLNRLLRDWRNNKVIAFDPKLFDLVWEVYRRSGAKNYIHVVSSYRSPESNELLRRTRGGQAKNSQHLYGKAMDFYIPGVKSSKLRAIAMKLQGGGVGYYPRSSSPYVHLDVASVRAWPRMSRKELVRLFPDGKTLHLPSDGKPLPGYNVALREYKRRGGGIDTGRSKPVKKETPAPARTVIAKADNNNSQNADSSGGLLGNLFGRRNNNNSSATPAPTQQVASASPAVTRAPEPTFAENTADLPRENIPVPTLIAAVADDVVPDVKPEITSPENVQLASLIPQPQERPEAIALAEVQPLAYDQPDTKRALPSLTAIIAAAVETDRKRKENGEVPTPTLASFAAPEEKRVDFASLETPELRAHNRLDRTELGASVSQALEDSRKGGRPNLRDAIAAKYKANASAPTLEHITISKRVFSQDSIVNMKPPAKAPRFVNRFMRKAPVVVYANGFSKENVDQQGQTTFSGNAVNFLPVVRYNG
jgi:uncharacterized protein YcbK (DUF882 family)